MGNGHQPSEQGLEPSHLMESRSLTLSELRTLWARVVVEGTTGVSVYHSIGERALQLGNPLFAYDVIQKGIEYHSGDKRLWQMLALALARSGSVLRANEIFSMLRREGHEDGETLGMLASTHKDLAFRTEDSEVRVGHLSKAYEIYHGAFIALSGSREADQALYNGINAAAMATLLGRESTAKRLARSVIDLTTVYLQQRDQGAGQYWALASSAEASLILGELQKAEDEYSRAVEVAGDRIGDISSTRHQARLLARTLIGDFHRFDHCLSIPSVVVCSGHLIDAPARPEPRFPVEKEEYVRDRIRSLLSRIGPGIGYASAACGADILFLEEMLARGSEINIVLPMETGEFCRQSVQVGGESWLPRFEQLLSRATQVHLVGEESLTDSESVYTFGNLMLDGLARLRARSLDTEVVALAIWDGSDGSTGGTGSFVEHWYARGQTVEVINPIDSAAASESPAPSPAASSMADLNIVSILFADFSGFTKLSEIQIPIFVDHVLGAIAQLADGFTDAIAHRNTWGDAVFLIFHDPAEAADFGLALCQMVESRQWTEVGLPDDLTLRVAMHAGPTYRGIDPVTKMTSYFGTHVSRAARIEPVTPPGQLYASESFAALAAAQGTDEFICDYVGQIPLAKDYGVYPIYHIRLPGGEFDPGNL